MRARLAHSVGRARAQVRHPCEAVVGADCTLAIIGGGGLHHCIASCRTKAKALATYVIGR